MRQIVALYRYVNFLSIDVAIGAVCGDLFFARILGVSISGHSLIALALTVWIIYTVDHLSDAKKVKASTAFSRHQFHQTYHTTLQYFLVAAIVLDVCTIFFIHDRIALGGLILAFVVGMYLLLHRYARYVKELVIATLYTAGIILPAAATANLPFNQLPWTTIIQFLLAALINLLLFSWFDYQNDLNNNFISLATLIGKTAIRKILVLLFLIVFALSFSSISQPGTWLILLMNVVLLVLFIKHKFFGADERYRIMGDAVFFIPVLLLWM